MFIFDVGFGWGGMKKLRIYVVMRTSKKEVSLALSRSVSTSDLAPAPHDTPVLQCSKCRSIQNRYLHSMYPIAENE
jgi:hypothetical protein